jgi:hypothetical protein
MVKGALPGDPPQFVQRGQDWRRGNSSRNTTSPADESGVSFSVSFSAQAAQQQKEKVLTKQVAEARAAAIACQNSGLQVDQPGRI